jgi:DNA-binding NarL/FixJ family response regulator
MSVRKSEQDTSDKARVLVVDDHAIVRDGLVRLINQEDDLEVCGEAEGVPDALQAVKQLKPDVAIIDLSLDQHLGGLDLVKDIRARHPSLPTLVLSMHDESVFAERALRAGARGYVMKEEATETVMTAIRRVLGGEIYLSDQMTSHMLSQLAGRGSGPGSPVDTLSDRELEVFQLIGEGFGTSQIAEKLHLSVKTIETYREHIKTKLGLADGTELLRHGIQWVQRRPS